MALLIKIKLVDTVFELEKFYQIISKKNTTLGIPLVVGIKYRFFENFIISFEAGARYTFTDDIDGNIISTEEIDYNFGNINNNDWYMFSIMNLSYTFGRKPCYCNIK